jgi:hypothetical protein
MRFTRVERRGFEPRRACLQGKPGHLSPPRRTHRGSRTLTPRRTPRPQRGPSTCSGRWVCIRALGGSRTHTSDGHRDLNPGRLPVPPREHRAHPHRDLNPGDRTENPAGCHYLMGAGPLGTVDGDRTRAVRIESPGWQPAATTALRAPYGTRTRDLPLDRRASTPTGPTEPGGRWRSRTSWPAATTRVATGRQATPASPSLAEGARIELARPCGPSVFETAAVAGHRLVPPEAVRRAGLEPACPRGDLVYSQAGQPVAQPTHVPQRWLPDVSAVGRCGDR